MAAGSGPVQFVCQYPDRLSRLHLLLKSFFGWIYVGIPHGIVLYVLGILSGVVTIVAFFAILFTGRYPRGLFDFVVGVRRWSLRVTAYWGFFLVDSYPPFSMESESGPVRLEVAYPERLSRLHLLLKFFFGWLYVWVPHGIALFFYWIAAVVVWFIAWWAVLILGRYPRSFFDFILGYLRWKERVNAYAFFLRDEYPPFSGRPWRYAK